MSEKVFSARLRMPAMLSFLLFALSLSRAVTVSASSLPCNCTPGIMTTPTYGLANAVFTVCASNLIRDPQHLTYDVLLNFSAYPAWNTFVYSVDLPPNVSSVSDVYVGMQMTFNTTGLIPGVNTTSDEVITYLEASAVHPFVAWRSNVGGGLSTFEAEHVSLLDSVGDGTIRYVSWETYYGPGALTVQALQSNLQKQFEVEGVDLKQRVVALTG